MVKYEMFDISFSGDFSLCYHYTHPHTNEKGRQPLPRLSLRSMQENPVGAGEPAKKKRVTDATLMVCSSHDRLFCARTNRLRNKA